MTIPITHGGCTSEELHRMASVCESVRHSRRIRAIAMVLDGVCRSEIAEAQGMTVQSIRDWVLRFNAHGPDGLADISAAVSTGRHAVLVLDGAGWHRSNDLEIPANISLLRLPPYSPELNPMENVFAFLKGNFLANQVFSTVDDVRSAIANAWQRFLSDPDRIKSITSREWAIFTR